MSEQSQVRTVYQGEFTVSNDPRDCLVTVLGSCVSACIYDPVGKIGGLNHFLLPHGSRNDPGNLRFGANSMELLINAILRGGGQRARLEAKLFGGARMMGELSDIGGANADFAEAYLLDEKIPCVSKSLRGDNARRVRFWPHSGRVQQMLVKRSEVVAPPAKTTPPITGGASEIEFF